MLLRRQLPGALPHLILISAVLALGTGCRHKPSRRGRRSTPRPEPHTPRLASAPTPGPVSNAPAPIPGPATVADSPADAEFVGSHPVIYSEEGMASWYGPPYDKRRGRERRNLRQGCSHSGPPNAAHEFPDSRSPTCRLGNRRSCGLPIADRSFPIGCSIYLWHRPKRLGCGDPAWPGCGWRSLLLRRRSTAADGGACRLAPSRMRRGRISCATSSRASTVPRM